MVVTNCELLAVYPVICGAGAAATDARGEDVRTADHVPSSGHQRSLLQSPASLRDYRQTKSLHAFSRFHRLPLHQAVDS